MQRQPFAGEQERRSGKRGREALGSIAKSGKSAIVEVLSPGNARLNAD